MAGFNVRKNDSSGKMRGLLTVTDLTLSLAGQVQRRQWRRRRRRLPATLMPRAARPPPPSRLRGDRSLEHSGYHAEIGAKTKQGGYTGFGLNQGGRTRDVNHKCSSNVRCGQTCRLARRLPWPACGTGRWRGWRARRGGWHTGAKPRRGGCRGCSVRWRRCQCGRCAACRTAAGQRPKRVSIGGAARALVRITGMAVGCVMQTKQTATVARACTADGPDACPDRPMAAAAEIGTASNGPGPWLPASRGGAGHAAAAGLGRLAAAAGWMTDDADAVGGGREDGEAGTSAPGMTEAARPPRPPASAPVATTGVRPKPVEGTHAVAGATAPRTAAHGGGLTEAAGGGITVHAAGAGAGGPRAAAGIPTPRCCRAATATAAPAVASGSAAAADATPVDAAAAEAAARWPPGGRSAPAGQPRAAKTARGDESGRRCRPTRPRDGISLRKRVRKARTCRTSSLFPVAGIDNPPRRRGP